MRISGKTLLYSHVAYRVPGQSVIVVMDNEGNINVFSLPELQLIHKENCVDAADAV